MLSGHQVSFKSPPQRSEPAVPMTIISLATGAALVAILFAVTGYTVSDIPYLLHF